ncbi:MAG: hypothetical protein IH899_18555, partial [Planctomycetes bacterium]|nr:hypothetical protein [Planctomycetota bacterium]
MLRTMKLMLACFAVLVATAGQRAEAGPIFYVNNPSGNSIDWTNAVTGLGGVV